MEKVIFGPIPFSEVEFTFLLESEALEVLALWDAYMESTTWKEFWERVGERGRSYFGVDEFVSATEEEATEEGLRWFPVDESAFDSRGLAEYSEWEWPPLAHIHGWHWLPEDIRWRYGTGTGGFTAGVWVIFPPTEITPVVAELQERGYLVEPNYDLVAWTCGGEQEYVGSALRSTLEPGTRRDTRTPGGDTVSESLASLPVGDTSDRDLGTLLETIVGIGFDWSLGWDVRPAGNVEGFGVEIHLTEANVISSREPSLEAALDVALSKALSTDLASRSNRYRKIKEAAGPPEGVSQLLELVGDPGTHVQQVGERESLTWSQYFDMLLECSQARGWWVYASRSAMRPVKQEYACYIRDVNGRHGTGWGTTIGGACVEGLVAMLQAEPQEIPRMGLY